MIASISVGMLCADLYNNSVVCALNTVRTIGIAIADSYLNRLYSYIAIEHLDLNTSRSAQIHLPENDSDLSLPLLLFLKGGFKKMRHAPVTS